MTDETKNLLEIHAAQYTSDSTNYGDDTWEWRAVKDTFIAGATHQHPISFEQGRKKGIEDAIKSVKKYDAYSVHIDNMKEDILKQLEALKKIKP